MLGDQHHFIGFYDLDKILNFYCSYMEMETRFIYVAVNSGIYRLDCEIYRKVKYASLTVMFVQTFLQYRCGLLFLML